MTAWTKTPPTEPGWYWWRRREGRAQEWTDGLPVLVGRWDDETRLRVMGGAEMLESHFVEEVVGEWQGPLRPEE